MLNRILISGLGAIGSVYASKLYEMEPECVRVIASKERIVSYKKDGVCVNGSVYPFNYIEPINTLEHEENAATILSGDSVKTDCCEKADLIIIAVKQHHLQQAIKDIKVFVGKDTIILSLLNGITSEEIIGQEFGMDKLLYSFVVGTDAVREERSTQYTKIGKIVFGEKCNEEYTHKVKLIKELFDAAKIPYEIPENMIRKLWWKFMMNVGINQVSAVLKAPYGIFQNISEARKLMEDASREVVQISTKAGINLNEDDIKSSSDIIDTLSFDGKTSMLQDIEAGRKTEVEIFAGTVIELGKKYGVVTPINDILFRMIRILEEKNYINEKSMKRPV